MAFYSASKLCLPYESMKVGKWSYIILVLVPILCLFPPTYRKSRGDPLAEGGLDKAFLMELSEISLRRFAASVSIESRIIKLYSERFCFLSEAFCLQQSSEREVMYSSNCLGRHRKGAHAGRDRIPGTKTPYLYISR